MSFDFELAPMPQDYVPKLNEDFENYEPIPNGRIDIEITNVEGKATTTGGTQLSFECVVLSPEYKGQKISYNSLAYVKGGERAASPLFCNFVYSLTTALGIAFPQFQSSAQILAFFKGKKFNAQIQMEAYTKKETNEEKITNRINFMGEIKALQGAFVASENQTVRNQGKSAVKVNSSFVPPAATQSAPAHVWQQPHNPVHVAQAPIAQGWSPPKTTAQILDDDIPL